MNKPETGFRFIGQPMPRHEDARLITGQGRFTDDFNFPGQAYAAMVRSPHAHARIVSIDKAPALNMPGVLGVFTGADCAADGLGPIGHDPLPKTRDDMKLTAPGGGEVFIGPHLLLPADKARHVGEAVAMVVAETKAQALDGAEALAVVYDELPFVLHSEDGMQPGAPSVWDEVPGNVLVDTHFGNAAATDRAFAQAAHIVARDFNIGRVTGVPMEPRACVANYDKASGRYTLHAGSGGAVRQKRELASVLGIEPDTLRVLSFDVGGNFGTRNRVYPEYGLILWASRKLGRPVKFLASRSECFISDYQGRDLVSKLELAIDGKGRFLALRATNISNAGARCVSLSPLSKGAGLITGNYVIPTASLRAVSVFTNTIPTQAYRSSGRPEVTFAIERLVDLAAAKLGIDRISLRRRNLVRPKSMPYRNAVGMTYDSGTYEDNMDLAMRIADWDGFVTRKREAKKRGKLLGLGLANYVESSIGAPKEQARITIKPTGVDVIIGTQPAGQGHETSFAQVVSDLLQVPVESVRIIMGDTDVVRAGGGTHSGRSMRHAATVFSMAATTLIANGKRIAAHLLDADNTEFNDGRFTARGTNRSFDFLELAQEMAQAPPARRPRQGPRRRHRQRDARSGVPERLRGVRNRDRSFDRRARADALRLRRRRRPLHQPAHRARADARRHRAGRRPSAVGAIRGRRFRPAAHRFIHGLRHAARASAAVIRHRDRRGALPDQSARHQGRRRRRHHRCAGGDRQRHRRCAQALRHSPRRHAGDALSRVAGDSRAPRRKTPAKAANPPAQDSAVFFIFINCKLSYFS